MIEPRQCRAARALLGWTQEDLAERAEIARITIRKFEAGITNPHRATQRALQAAFENAGITFIDDEHDEGVKVRKA